MLRVPAFVYSDINFIVLGALVERLSGESLDEYAARHVFVPLGMTETRFLPPTRGGVPRIAPTGRMREITVPYAGWCMI